MGTHVLSLRIDGNLLDRLRTHAAKRDMPVQDYVLQLLQRNDFDERVQTAEAESARLTHWPTTTNPAATTTTAPHGQLRPSQRSMGFRAK
ncbi:hypothetical protein [Streptomyces sp. CMB-StM0423]|uniref:hypothetical protein n=1 Tax=Streptomyces sp. CMB-StM0423 TaxID=2059884 RepID=UPI002D79D42F|nr:hypothetical protein [Streptomyces sp. CMB-StM0423]